MDILTNQNYQLQISFLHQQINQLNSELAVLRQLCDSNAESQLKIYKGHIERLSEERNNAQSKCLLLQQLYLQSKEEIQEVKLQAQQYINDLQLRLEQSSLAYNYDNKNEGIITKYKYIGALNETTLRLHNEITQLTKLLIKAQTELAQITEQNNCLKLENLRLRKQVGDINQENIQEQEVESLEYVEDYELKVNASRLCDNTQSQIKSKLIPRLDMKKAIQIQQCAMADIRDKKDQHSILNHQAEVTKWIQEYKQLRQQYDAQIILNNQLQVMLLQTQQSNNTCMTHNEILTKSYLKQELVIKRLREQEQLKGNQPTIVQDYSFATQIQSISGRQRGMNSINSMDEVTQGNQEYVQRMIPSLWINKSHNCNNLHP